MKTTMRCKEKNSKKRKARTAKRKNKAIFIHPSSKFDKYSICRYSEGTDEARY